MEITAGAGTVAADSSVSKAFVSNKSGGHEYSFQNIDYLPFSYPFKGEENEGLIKLKRAIIMDSKGSIKEASCKISPVYIAKQDQKVAWDLSLPVDALQYQDGYLLGTRHGSEDLEDAYIMINPTNGNEVMRYTSQFIDALIPNIKDRRFVGFFSLKTTKELIENNKEGQLGIITYASNRRKIDTYRVLVKNADIFKMIPPYTPDMIFLTNMDVYRQIEDGRRLALMNLTEDYKPEDIGNFSAQFTFYKGDDMTPLTISIPVTKDRLDVDHATYDKSIFTLEAIK